MKNKGTAILLSFLLGGLGAHKFYLGEGGRGLMYLLFVWTFIPSILGLIDMIKLITTSQDKFDRIYNPLFVNMQRRAE